jgi:hypothetical protein
MLSDELLDRLIESSVGEIQEALIELKQRRVDKNIRDIEAEWSKNLIDEISSMPEIQEIKDSFTKTQRIFELEFELAKFKSNDWA